MAGIYTVTQINTYIKTLLNRDFVLSRITVKGEVSNCKYHSSGHIYFTLKDASAAIGCVMFATQRQRLSFRLQDGQQIEAAGQITLYEKSGSCQLYVRECRLSGAGELYERFLRLKAELEEMGMFDPCYKQPVPRYCRKIGIVTSPTGAAIQDIIRVSTQRNPYVELILCPALVQGEGAKESIVRGIERLDAMGLDVLIVGRGGGSIEDLWAFNEECVARAIFNARTPVISAVGHETDYTIADFAADVRAATPSQAAELANFEYAAFEDELEAYENAIQRQLEQRLVIAGHRLAALRERLQRLAPMQVLDRRREELDRLELRFRELLEQRCERLKEETGKKKTELDRQMEHRLTECRHRLRLQAARLDGFSPLKRISGGYGYLVGEDGKQIDSVRRVHPGQEMTVYLHDGRIQSRIESAELLEQDNICRETEKK